LELLFDGYTISRLDRISRGGGILILTKNKYKITIENTHLSESIELLHISCEVKESHPLQIITVYRPPHSSIGGFIDSLTNYLNNIDYATTPMILMGDINIDMNSNSTAQRDFVRLLNLYNLTVKNKKTTRIGKNSSTLIDLVITNSLASNYITDISTNTCHFSDHNQVTFAYKKNLPKKLLRK